MATPPLEETRPAAYSARSRSRSRSPGAERFRGGAPPRGGYRAEGPRRAQAPDPSNVLGVFALSIRTRERDLEEVFGRFGTVEKATIVYDQRSDRSRGFGFVTMSTMDEATKCIQELNGIELNDRRIRVDYSLTERAHPSTPGEYMGYRRDRDRREIGGRGRYDRDRDRDYRSYRDRDRHDDRRDPYGRDDRDRNWRDDRDRRRKSPEYSSGRRYSRSPSPRRRRSPSPRRDGDTKW